MCCSVMQFDDTCGSSTAPTSRCVAACCSVLQRATVCYSVLQHVAAFCSVLHVAACCSVLQRAAACCNLRIYLAIRLPLKTNLSQHTHCNSLQRYNAQQHTAPRTLQQCCNTLQYSVHLNFFQTTRSTKFTTEYWASATHCNTLQHMLQHTATHCNCVTHCNTMQRTLGECNTLQRTATHCNTL